MSLRPNPYGPQWRRPPFSQRYPRISAFCRRTPVRRTLVILILPIVLLVDIPWHGWVFLKAYFKEFW